MTRRATRAVWYSSGMAVSREWEEFVVEQMAELGRVRSRRMFGGVGLYLDDTFFGLIAGAGDVFLKVDDGNRPDYEAAGTGPFRPFSDHAYAMSFWQVPAEVLDDPEEMAAWARKAVAAARRRAAEPRKRARAATAAKTATRQAAKATTTRAKAARTRTARAPRPKRG